MPKPLLRDPGLLRKTVLRGDAPVEGPSQQQEATALRGLELQAVEDEANVYRSKLLETTRKAEEYVPYTGNKDYAYTSRPRTTVDRGAGADIERHPFSRPPVGYSTAGRLPQRIQGQAAFEDDAAFQKTQQEAAFLVDDRPLTPFTPFKPGFKDIQPLQELPKFNYPSYVSRLTRAESGGDPSIKNPQSSATGLYQFVEKTWLDLGNKSHPEIFKGRSETEKLNFRKNPEISDLFLRSLTGENQAHLKEKGVPISNQSMYLAHFASPQVAAELMKASGTDPLSKYMTKKALADNGMTGKTVGWIKQWASKKMGG